MTEKGRFITLEGGEGAGKTSQINRLKDWLTGQGFNVLTTREPGGSEGAEQIRELLVNGDVVRWDAMTEALLNLAARRDHVKKIIKPALEGGTWVISDRFADSTTAYQGYGHGLGPATILALYDLVLPGFKTDLTIMLDLETEVGISRALGRSAGEDRYERMDIEFHKRLRHGFLEIAANNPDRCAVIDASGDLDEVFAGILSLVQDRLEV